MPVLVKFSNNWADEFDCEGFKVYATMEEWLVDAELIKKTKSFSFGSNQGWDDEEAEDFISNYEVIEISDIEYAALAKLFPDSDHSSAYGYGVFPLGSDEPEYEEDDEYNGDGEEEEAEGSPS